VYHLLLIDSDENSRTPLATLFRDWGFDVSSAGSGLEGVRLAAEVEPDLIVLDLWPFTSALDTASLLRTTGATGPTPVLLLSSAVTPALRRLAEADDGFGFLEKPCPPDRVLREIRRILPRRWHAEHRPRAQLTSASRET
jgi:DNA-binding response OmpR family regulator